MAVKCYIKPNRSKPRTFSAKDVGRITCAAVEDGVSQTSIREEVSKCVQVDKECEEVRDKLKQAEAVIAISIVVLAVVIPAFRVVVQAIQFLRIFRRIRNNVDIVQKELDDLFKRLKEIDLPAVTTVN